MTVNPTDAPVCIGVVPRGTPAPADARRLNVILIKPSKYDDDGYVMRFVRGVLPSNTMATLAGLTEEVVEKGELGQVDVQILMMDEIVQRIEPKRLARKFNRPGMRAIVALCGVQTNQFPRAADLAREFKAAGMPVMMGGFHVSGSIAMSENGVPSECQSLMDEGITLVKGEVEDCWGDLLRDALHGRLKTFYEVTPPPDISEAYIPVVDPKLMKRFAYPFMGTIDAGRGCPFNCSFCTIINVQGRKMRNRLAARIKERIRENSKLKIDYYFFTDDNFSRNPNWEDILDAINELRREEGISVQFMIQVDVVAYRIPNFVAKAAEAGCSQVFIGMETINPANLAAAGKRQNNVEDYQNMIQAWHSHGVATHVGYIIGFPHDSPESVREDVRRLKDEIGVDQASFFMLTPLPGSKDHQDMVRKGEWMDEDYNRFDSFHASTNHPNMTKEQWFEAYQLAWREFYSVDTMKAILARANNVTYWGLFKNFVWYKYSAIIEQTHPMICGFFRLKDRTQRRPGYAVDPLWRHWLKRGRELAHLTREIVRFYFEMQEVWLATRGRAQFRQNVEDLVRRAAEMRGRLGDSASRAGEAINSRVVAPVKAGATNALARAGEVRRQTAEDIVLRLARLRQIGTPRFPRLRALASKLNPLVTQTCTRMHLNAYWRQTFENVRRGRLLKINPFRLAVNFLRDIKLCMLFNLNFFGGYGR